MASNNQVLPQNTNAGLESASAAHPHLDIEQAQGIPALDFIRLPRRHVAGSPIAFTHPVTKHSVTITYEKLP